MFVALLSSFFSIYKYDSLYALARIIVYFLMFYLLVYNYHEKLEKMIVAIVVGMGAILSLYGIMQYFNYLPHKWWDPEMFLASTYVNHNHFAGYLELVIPVTLGGLLLANRQREILREKI